VNDYAGVILAGGRGARMGALGDAYPKALMPLAAEPLIGHHLRLLRDLGIREVFVLVGHRSADIVDALGTGQAFGLDVRFVDQGDYLGSAHALGRFRGLVRRPFVLLLGDYYCSLSDPFRLLRRLDAGASAIAAKREPDPRLVGEACELRVDADGRVIEIVEKPAVPHGDLKGCGVYALQPDIFDSVARTPRTALRDEYELTHAIQLHVEAGRPLYGEDMVGWDRNFTRPEDVLEANLDWLERTHNSSLAAEEARIDDRVRLQRSVIGKRARIGAGSELDEVVVFDDASLPGGSSIKRALVTPDGVIRLGDQGGAASVPLNGELQLTGKEVS
jgi:NDP-sugar pyrophosphorylase family protein